MPERLHTGEFRDGGELPERQRALHARHMRAVRQAREREQNRRRVKDAEARRWPGLVKQPDE